MDTKAVKTGLGKIKGMFGSVASTAGKAFKMGGKGLLAGAGIAGAAAAAVGAMTVGTARWAKNLKTVSDQTGVSVKDTLALREAFKAAGVEISDDADLISDFQEKIEDAARGGGTGEEGYAMLGLSAHGLRRLQNPLQQLDILMEAVQKSQLNVQGRAFALDKIFGGQGFKLVHLSKNYSKFMGQARKDTEDLANTLDDKLMGELVGVMRIVDRIKLQFRLGLVKMAAALPLDKITGLIDKVLKLSASFLSDPAGFLTEVWVIFETRMRALWDDMLKALTAAMAAILPKIPSWLKAPPEDEPRSFFQKLLHGEAPLIYKSPAGGGTDATTGILQSIDATMLRIDRKPGASFA